MSKRWPAEEVERLRSLWGQNKSGSEIAKALRTTRGSVLGKLNRLGLLGQRDETKSHPGPRIRDLPGSGSEGGSCMMDDEHSLPSFIRERLKIDSLL